MHYASIVYAIFLFYFILLDLGFVFIHSRKSFSWNSISHGIYFSLFAWCYTPAEKSLPRSRQCVWFLLCFAVLAFERSLFRYRNMLSRTIPTCVCVCVCVYADPKVFFSFRNHFAVFIFILRENVHKKRTTQRKRNLIAFQRKSDALIKIK